MRSTQQRPAPTCWAPFAPGEREPWDLRRVVHLHRAAGFAATWGEIRRDLGDGPGPSVDRVLAGRSRGRGVAEDFDRHAARLAASARDAGRLKAWWVYRMLFGPDPLTERLTLFWHNHFATGNDKVRDLAAMRRQNEILRTFGRGPFGELLRRVVKDPALLVYLDAPANRRGSPNENLARELMELFTLGIGHYTERDVREAARALTGWTVADGRFREDRDRHDSGEKTILGRTGRWTGDDLLTLLLEHPAAAARLAARLCDLFFGEGAVGAQAVRALADGLRARNLNIGWAVATVLRSRPFFAAANLGTRVLSPVEYVVGAARALELFDPPPSTLVLAQYAARLGQDLFYPPNVGGWPGGRAWISSGGIIGRANYVVALLDGIPAGRPGPFDALALARRHGRAADLETAVTFYAELLLGVPPATAWRERLLAALGPAPRLEPQTLRRAVHLLLASPDAQLA